MAENICIIIENYQMVKMLTMLTMLTILTMVTLLMMLMLQAMGGFPPPEITWWIGTRRLQPEQTVGLPIIPSTKIGEYR